MAKPRRKSSRRSQELKRPAHKTVASDGINFFALLVGFTITLTLVLLAWSRLAGETGVLFPFLQAAGADSASGAVKQVDLEQLIASGNLAELERALIASKERPVGNVNSSVDNYNEQLRLAKAILDQKPATDLERLATRIQLDALSQLSQLRLTGKRDTMSSGNIQKESFRLRRAIRSAMDSRDPELEEIATLVEARYLAMEVDPDRANVDEVASKLSSLLKQGLFRDELLHLTGEAMLRRVASRNSDAQGAGLRLAEKLQQQLGESQDAQLQRLVRKARDIEQLMRSRYREDDSDRELLSSKKQQALIDKACKLAQDAQMGMLRLSRIRQTAYWFESDRDEYALAQRVYQVLLDFSPQYVDPEVALLAGRVGRDGLLRCQMVNQPLRLEGTLADGSPLDASELSNRVVLLYFWSVHQPSHRLEMDRLTRQCRSNWKSRPLSVICVCVDPLDESFSLERVQNIQNEDNRPSSWIYCVRNPDGSLPLLDQCPSDDLPRYMLLNQEHQIVDPYVLQGDLEVVINLLLDK